MSPFFFLLAVAPKLGAAAEEDVLSKKCTRPHRSSVTRRIIIPLGQGLSRGSRLAAASLSAVCPCAICACSGQAEVRRTLESEPAGRPSGVAHARHVASNRFRKAAVSSVTGRKGRPPIVGWIISFVPAPTPMLSALFALPGV